MFKNTLLVITLCFSFSTLTMAEPLTTSSNITSINNIDNNAETQFITVEQLQAKLSNKESIVILDLRGGDYDSSPTKIKGATRIAPADLEKHLTDLPKDKIIVTYCSCPTDGGAIAGAQTLMKNGFKQVFVLKGGWKAWNTANGALENK